MKRAHFALSLALLVAAPALNAEPRVRVEGPTVRLADVVTNVPAELADFELCKAPPAGASRVLTRGDVLEKLRTAGADTTRLVVPASVRVETLAERWTPADVTERASSHVKAALQPGVELLKLKASQGAVVPVGTNVKGVSLRVPRRAGTHQLSAMAELVRDGDVVARLPLSVSVTVSELALEPTVRRGALVSVYVENGNARVGASASALADTDAGEVAWFKVSSTGKVVKARVESRDLAKVVQ
ncbi:MAG TPA: flagella basal body P-ring formation protein FlgA [Polyangiaceae bacterium]